VYANIVVQNVTNVFRGLITVGIHRTIFYM